MCGSSHRSGALSTRWRTDEHGWVRQPPTKVCYQIARLAECACPQLVRLVRILHVPLLLYGADREPYFCHYPRSL